MMNPMKIKQDKQIMSWLMLTMAIFVFSGLAKGQALSESYEEMIKTSSTYQEYKVVKKEKLDGFMKAVEDSLRQAHLEVAQLTDELKIQKTDIRSLENRITELDASLKEINLQKESIQVLGINFSKMTFKVIFWVLILGLGLLTVFFFLRFKKTDKETSAIRKSFKSAEAELDQVKKNYREKELKLKRELQTAINTIDELSQ